jgi:Tfp pilus assembly protein PilV
VSGAATGLADRWRGQRGTSLIELMIASAIIIVAVTGFMGAMRDGINATAVGHRRTEATLLRTGFIERITVARRSQVAAVAGQGWIIESCYDADAKLKTPSNTLLDVAYACPAGSAYARHLSAVAVPDAAGLDQRTWSVALYVERLDRPCAPATRYQTLGCVAADLYLTD